MLDKKNFNGNKNDVALNPSGCVMKDGIESRGSSFTTPTPKNPIQDTRLDGSTSSPSAKNPSHRQRRPCTPASTPASTDIRGYPVVRE